MDNAQKAIMIGVGLFITIIIIAAVMLITGMGQNLLNKGQSQVNGISASLQNDLFENVLQDTHRHFFPFQVYLPMVIP